MAISRENSLLMPKQWAEDGSTVIPNPPVAGTTYRDESVDAENIAEGQQYDGVADSARWNQLLYIITGILKDTLEHGVLPWLNTQDYAEGAVVMGSNGTLYIAKKANGPTTTNAKDPTTDTTAETWKTVLTISSTKAPLALTDGALQISVGEGIQIKSDKLELKPYKGATASESGELGGVPPAAKEDKDKFLKGDGSWAELANKVLPFTPPTAEAPGKEGLVPQPHATPENKLLNRFLSANGGWSGIDLCALHPTAQSAELNKVLLDMGGVPGEGVNIDTLLRSGFFTANAFAGTLPDGIAGGLLINIMSLGDDGLYYGQQILISYINYGLYFRGNITGVQPGGIINWFPWSCLTPIPQTAAGVGLWSRAGNFASGSSYTFPQKGTYAYYLLGTTSSGSYVNHVGGVAAGGSTITVTGSNIVDVHGFTWRIQ